MQDLYSHKLETMVKNIQNFDKIYGEQIYPADGMVYTIEKANVIKTHSEPELLEYIAVKLLDMYNNHRPAEYSVAIFADNKDNQNLACVYKRGESSSVFTDKDMHPIHFKTKDLFKTYVITLINKAL